VIHEILLDKLHFYGILGVSEDWFRSYLANRRQKVQVKSPNTAQKFFSDWGTIINRFLRRSILWPLLLVIYTNDLHLRINSISETILFADDTSVVITGRNLGDFCAVSNLVLSYMIKWFASNN